MEKKTMRQKTAALRKEHKMTQLQLAEQMGVTDKEVSKQERDLSSPDLSAMPDWQAFSRSGG
ncbi:MAG: helix-turn-helix transcriptional regulator [Erysipelotrichaceae bacterium]|nr:helix-turn-helix transcriptional regulator [Erysipelotrichaceae bacterium]